MLAEDLVAAPPAKLKSAQLPAPLLSRDFLLQAGTPSPVLELTRLWSFALARLHSMAGAKKMHGLLCEVVALKRNYR